MLPHATVVLDVVVRQHVGAFASPPAISPTINDMRVLSVVPIAAYLGVQQMLKFMEAHVQMAPTVDTILAFEKCAVDDVVWGDKAYACIFTNSTNVSSITRPTVQIKGPIKYVKSYACVACKHGIDIPTCIHCKASYGCVSVPGFKPLSVLKYNDAALGGVATSTNVLDRCSAKTIRGLLSYVINQKCLDVPDNQ